jgi:hypothetical protein
VQEELLKAVAAIGKPLVVVLENGSALAVNWAQEHANAILEAWYPGEEGGTSIAETLAGDNNPAGRLPLTFYSSLSQAPPLTTTPWKAAPTVTSPTNRSIASASVSATLTHLQQHQAPLLKYQSRRPGHH